MRARVARFLRVLATRIDGPVTVTINLPGPMTRAEIAAIAAAANQTGEYDSPRRGI